MVQLNCCRWRQAPNLLCCRTQRSNPLTDKPARERHFLSMGASISSVVLLIISLALPWWATAIVKNHNCSFGLIKVSCIHPASEEYQQDISLSDYYQTSQQILISCVLSISVLTMISSLIAAFISAGFPREKLEFLRHYSVFNIVSLLCIILVAGFWLSVVETIPNSTSKDSLNQFKGTVVFGYAFYIYMAGGVMSLIAACLNLLRARSAVERRMIHRLRFRRQIWREQQTRRPPQVQLLQIPRPAASQEQQTQQPNTSEGGTAGRPPEYTAVATTEFILDNTVLPEADDEEEIRETTSDTEPLVSPPPPYTP